MVRSSPYPGAHSAIRNPQSGAEQEIDGGEDEAEDHEGPGDGERDDEEDDSEQDGEEDPVAGGGWARGAHVLLEQFVVARVGAEEDGEDVADDGHGIDGGIGEDV